MNKLFFASSTFALGLALLPAAYADGSHAKDAGYADESHAGHAEQAEGMSKIWPSTASGPPEKVIYDAASAMEFMRSLSGDWYGTNSTGPVSDSKKAGYEADSKRADGTISTVNDTSFHTLGRGSFVEQAYLQGTPAEMRVMYHMDGPNKLLFTHFCSARNVPELQFVKTDKPGQIKWEFVGGTNLNVNVDGHAHSAIFQILDKDSFEIFTETYNKGRPVNSYVVYHRKNPSQGLSASVSQ